jgi:hypothetical protein
VDVQRGFAGFRVGAAQRMADAERDFGLRRLDEILRQASRAESPKEEAIVVDAV